MDELVLEGLMDTETAGRFRAAQADALAEIARCDAKSGVLLSGLSLPLAVLVATVPGREMPVASSVLVGVGTAGLVAAVLLVLGVVLPRLDGAPAGSFLHWAACTPREAAADIQAMPSVEDSAAHVVRLSQIAREKYMRLRAAVFATAGSLVALAAAVPAALV